MRCLLVQNYSTELPGRVQGILDRHKIPYDIIDLDRGNAFPDPRRYSAVFVFGGPDSANDRTEKMRIEIPLTVP